MNKEQRQVIGICINKIKDLKRYELWWEQMNEDKKGEYVKYKDIFQLLKNMLD